MISKIERDVSIIDEKFFIIMIVFKIFINSENKLLNTIRFPKNFHYLTDWLPKPNYAPLKVKKISN